MEKIRSFYILKKIFNYLYNKIKFSIIVHNKKLQKKLGLKINDYITFSGRYLEKLNNKVIEYNSYNHLKIYEGDYSNGKRNGKGIEYNEKNEIIFEGIYLDGKKWEGIGKEYDEDTGKLIFKCEYSNGIINGEAEEYDKYNGDLLFSGKYFNDKRNGKGEEYKYIIKENNDHYYHSYSYLRKSKITIFSGEYLNGERKEGKE